MAFTIFSSAFADGSQIPSLYTCEGKDISPPLTWSGAPEGTKSYALLCDDPDAPMGTWHHWAIFNIPSTVTGFPEAYPAKAEPPIGQAINDSGELGYGGPCPPRKHGVHHYRFKLLALDVPVLALPPQVKYQDVEKASAPHVLGSAMITGIYSRE